jgi:hypothetical protein
MLNLITVHHIISNCHSTRQISISRALYLTQIIYQQGRASCKELTEEWRFFYKT